MALLMFLLLRRAGASRVTVRVGGSMLWLHTCPLGTCGPCLQVHQLGISTKYGRKVLGRLEKVQAVRDELYAAKFEQPANMGRMRKALDDAAAYSTLIDASLLGSIQVGLSAD